MTATEGFARLYSICPLDLSAIDAVGFDLDHTLAIYDDAAVNRLAAYETIDILRNAGYAVPPLAMEPLTMTARGLSMDLRHGNILKIGADGQVRLARRGLHWLSPDEVAAHYDGHDPADAAATWHVYSPFDIPTLWFFAALGPGIRDAHDSADAGRLLGDIRRSLDASHTRGELKRHIARDLGRFVTPAGDIATRLVAWKRAGKRLFIVTNSDPVFARAVLEHVLGSAWRTIFDLVVVDAAKPRFFADDYAHEGTRITESVVDGASASWVEATLGVPAARILYAGDNARSDVIPARRRGWRTAHVVAELSGVHEDTAWAAPLHHLGAPTWFARMIHDHADAACARIDAFLAVDPSSTLTPENDFYARVTA